MRTVGQIIRDRREALGLTLGALAQEVGATKGYLSMIENHRVERPPSATLLAALEKALGITDGELSRAADWANTPQNVREELQRLASSAAGAQELTRWLRESTQPRKDGSRNLDRLFKSGELSKRITDLLALSPGEGEGKSGITPAVPVRYQVPLINQVAAGYPRDFTDLGYPARVADTYVSCPDVSDPQAFAATVVGESMHPQYVEGDIVIFSPAAKVTDGCDCFVRLEPDHQSTFKRIFFESKNQIRLQPLNPKFPPQVVHRDAVAGLYRAVARYQKL